MHSSSSAVTRHLFCAVSIGGCLWKLAVCNHGNEIFQAMSLNMLNWFPCYHQICWYSESYSSNPNNWKLHFIEFPCGVGTFLHSSLLVIRRPSETFCSSWVCKHHGNDKLHGTSQYQYKAKNHKTWHFDLWSSLIKHLPRPSESTSLKARMNKEPHGPFPLEPRMRHQMGHSIENTFMMYPLRDLKLSKWQWYIPNDSTKCFIPTLIGVSVIVTHSINMYQQFAGRWR